MTDGEPAAGPTLRRLVASIVAAPSTDVPTEALGEELIGWATGAPAFRAYLERYRDKIRKKLRGSADDEARADVRAELLFARLLLADRRFELAFEAHGSQRRGPDYSVLFRRTTPFDVEVTRLRRGPTEGAIVGTTAAKVRQLTAGTPNVLVLACDAVDARALDLSAAMATLRRRADAWDGTFFGTRGFDTRRAFYDRFLRLGALVAWCPDTDGQARADAWVNPAARTAAPHRALAAVVEALRARP